MVVKCQQKINKQERPKSRPRMGRLFSGSFRGLGQKRFGFALRWCCERVWDGGPAPVVPWDRSRILDGSAFLLPCEWIQLFGWCGGVSGISARMRAIPWFVSRSRRETVWLAIGYGSVALRWCGWVCLKDGQGSRPLLFVFFLFVLWLHRELQRNGLGWFCDQLFFSKRNKRQVSSFASWSNCMIPAPKQQIPVLPQSIRSSPKSEQEKKICQLLLVCEHAPCIFFIMRRTSTVSPEKVKQMNRLFYSSVSIPIKASDVLVYTHACVTTIIKVCLLRNMTGKL